MGFALYLFFMISWFLHLPARIPILGGIRFDLLLILTLAGLALTAKEHEKQKQEDTIRWLGVLIFYILLTIPFVEWPGSVIKIGLPNFIKGVIFFLFTWKFVRTEKELKIFMIVFLGCQVFRIMEPVYLHLTEGYWGSKASMRGWISMERLSGAPSDVINPNGLAFICITVLPFLYYYASYSKWTRIALPLLILPTLYALALTGSRSGMVGLIVLLLVFAARSRRKLVLPILLLLGLAAGYQQLGENLQDRYNSIFDEGAANASTFESRIENLKADLALALRRPLFGHGLGTSLETVYNFRGGTHLAHNLIAEILQEIGFIGLIIFVLFVLSLWKKIIFFKTNDYGNIFLDQTSKALIAWFYMNIVFSMATFGLSSHEWYLFAAVILIVHNYKRRLADKDLDGKSVESSLGLPLFQTKALEVK